MTITSSSSTPQSGVGLRCLCFAFGGRWVLTGGRTTRVPPAPAGALYGAGIGARCLLPARVCPDPPQRAPGSTELAGTSRSLPFADEDPGTAPFEVLPDRVFPEPENVES